METPLGDNWSSSPQGLVLLFGLNLSMNLSRSVRSSGSSPSRHAHCAGVCANAIAMLAFFATGKSCEMLASCWNDYEHVEKQTIINVEYQEQEAVWKQYTRIYSSRCRVLHYIAIQLYECIARHLDDEDERDERREGLLREARDVAHESAQVERHDEHQQERHPEADPQAEAHEVDLELAARAQRTRGGRGTHTHTP